MTYEEAVAEIQATINPDPSQQQDPDPATVLRATTQAVCDNNGAAKSVIKDELMDTLRDESGDAVSQLATWLANV